MKKRITKAFIHSKEELEELYKNLGSIGKVAAHFSKSYNTVRYWYKKYDIEFETAKSLFHELKDTPLSDLHRSIVLGSILGDGHIDLPHHSKNARLSINHSEKQLSYLAWKNKMLKPFSADIKLREKAKKHFIKGREVYSTDCYYFRTISHQDLTIFHERFYKNRIKTIDESVINDLDLLSLGVWYSDDGSVHIDKRSSGSVYLNMATNGFSYEEQFILMEALAKFFKGTIRTYQHSDKDRHDYYIRMYRTKHVIEFLKMISSVLPKCIHYKLGLQRLGVEPLDYSLPR